MNLKGGASDDGIFICIRRQEAHMKHWRPFILHAYKQVLNTLATV